MKPETLREELEELVEQKGYEVRKEKGAFRGDHCIMEGEKLVLINKSRPIDIQLGVLARLLHQLEVEDIYIKPRVRKQLEKLWDRLQLK